MAELTQFAVLSTLGVGGYGVVQLIRHPTWGKVACKEVKSLTVSSSETEMQREASIQQNLRHPSIVILYDFQFQPSSCRLFLEYMKYGSVDEFLKNYRTSWPWKIQITSEVALGMAYLHKQMPGIIHGDLTCGNILIGYEYHAKVSDFGLARMKEMSKTRTEKLRGTKKYIAPEYFINPQKKKTESYDVYGFAICVWEIFSEKPAYYDHENKNIIDVFVGRGERPSLKDIDEEVPSFVSDLIKECWDDAVDRRPTFDDINANLSPQIQSTLEPIKREERFEEQTSTLNPTGSLDQTVNQQYNLAGN